MQRVEQNAFTSSQALARVTAFALIGFGLMSFLTWNGLRGLTIVVGSILVGALCCVTIWYRLQERYPAATLYAHEPLQFGKPFSGFIEVDRSAAGGGRVKLQLYYFFGRRGLRTLQTQAVEQDKLRPAGEDKVRVPYSFPPLEPFDAERICLRVRSRFFPIGWGATFVVWPA